MGKRELKPEKGLFCFLVSESGPFGEIIPGLMSLWRVKGLGKNRQFTVTSPVAGVAPEWIPWTFYSDSQTAAPWAPENRSVLRKDLHLLLSPSLPQLHEIQGRKRPRRLIPRRLRGKRCQVPHPGV